MYLLYLLLYTFLQYESESIIKTVIGNIVYIEVI